MKRSALLLVVLLSCCLAQRASADPKIEEVFQGVSGSLSKPTDMTKVAGLVLAIGGLVGVMVAIRYMQQKSDPARPLHHHRRLMREISVQTGLSKRTLKTLEPMTRAEGLSNPIVAMLCPSTLKKLSQKVQTPEQKEALLDAARRIARADGAKASK